MRHFVQLWLWPQTTGGSHTAFPPGHHKENKLVYWNYTDTHYFNTREKVLIQQCQILKDPKYKTWDFAFEKKKVCLQAHVIPPEEKFKNDKYRTWQFGVHRMWGWPLRPPHTFPCKGKTVEPSLCHHNAPFISQQHHWLRMKNTFLSLYFRFLRWTNRSRQPLFMIVFLTPSPFFSFLEIWLFSH